MAKGFRAGLKTLYDLWMKFAAVLAWINTRILLVIMFYLVFTPTGFIMRLFGADPLDLKMDKNKNSYWIKKEGHTDYERQF